MLMTRILAAILFVSLLGSGCSGTSATQTDAQKVAKAPAGNDNPAASSNPECKLFSPAEVIFHNIETGRVHAFGDVAEGVLVRSFYS